MADGQDQRRGRKLARFAGWAGDLDRREMSVFQAQRVGDFLKGVPSTRAGDVEPTYRPGVTYTSLDSCLPGFVAETMRLAITRMDRRLHGFASPGALLNGVETRSSSPLRITRNERCVSSVEGIYPCGEGAGYAGGILSAAVDGIRCAEAALSAHCKGE